MRTQPVEWPNTQQDALWISCLWTSAWPCEMVHPDTSWNNPISMLTSHPWLLWAGQAPPSLSHIFHWKAKWYSMLPIASLLSLHFFHPCVLCAADRFERSRGTARLSRRRRRTSGDSRLARPATWQTPDFTLASWSARNSASPTAGKTTQNEIQERRRSENHFPFDEEIWLPWHAEVISYLAVKDAPWSPCSLEPGLCLLLTPALGHEYEKNCRA